MGPTCHICFLPAPPASISLSLFMPPRPHSPTQPPPLDPRAVHLHAASPSEAAVPRTTAGHPRRQRFAHAQSAPTPLHSRTARAPAPPEHHRRLRHCVHVDVHAAAPPHFSCRNRRRSALIKCSTVCPSRDGSREEEGKGGCCREACPQADSRRERGREGQDGGQGRRGAGVRPCSSVRDSGAASQG